MSLRVLPIVTWSGRGQGESDEAIRKLEQAIGLSPGFAPAYRDLGRIYMRRREPEMGVRYYREYLELAPNATDASTYRAIVANYP